MKLLRGLVVFAQITNVRVMKQKEILPEEVQLTVFIEGPNRMGIVSMKRRRSLWASGKVSAIRGDTCIRCGHTDLFAANPDRLFSDLRSERGR